jgi:ATP-dependent Clp protease protease subunit
LLPSGKPCPTEPLVELPISFPSSTTAEEELRLMGVYYIQGDIDDGSLTDIHQDMLLKYLTGWDKDFQIFINSGGGETTACWALIDLIKFLEQRITIKTIGIGSVCSMAAVLLAAGSKKHRFLSPRCSVMVHQPRLFAYMEGKKDDILSHVEDISLEYERFVQFWIEHSKCKTKKQVEQKLLPGRDHNLTSEQAIELGIADKIMK